jgi:hypothetical protein
MNTTTYKNKLNGEKFVCLDPKNIEIIEGVEYIFVQRINEQRTFKMRKDALEKISSKKKFQELI